ncbi:DUF2339 domain-containing protein [Vibrio sp. MA40-2]|uniref:DUF2339 domain-containing protein n=1 Tax=Vibrio sp. MA40-2 TaxID=3391828 RepID=UPI0039A682F2
MDIEFAIIMIVTIGAVFLPLVLSIIALAKAKKSQIMVEALNAKLAALVLEKQVNSTDEHQTELQTEISNCEVNDFEPTESPLKSGSEASAFTSDTAEYTEQDDNEQHVEYQRVELASNVDFDKKTSDLSTKLLASLSKIRNALPDSVSAFIDKISPIAFVGLAIVFVGLSFLIKLTYDAFSVPLWAKLSAISFVGIACVALGWRLRNKPNYIGMGLQGSGMAVLYLVAIAAGRYFSFISIEVTFFIVSMLVIFTTLLALLQNSQLLAIVAVLAGFAVPVLLSTDGAGSHLILLGYYLLLNIGLVYLAYKKQWYFLEKCGAVATFVLVEFWLIFSYQPAIMFETLPFLGSYFLLYFLLTHSHACQDFVNKKQIISSSLVFSLPLTSYALFYTATETVADYTAYCSLFLSLCYAIAAWVSFKYQKNNPLTSVYTTFALLFVAIAIPVFFSATFSAAIYALKSVTVLWVSNKQQRNRFALVGVGMLLASFYQLFQLFDNVFLHANVLLEPMSFWSWITPVLFVCTALAFYAAEWRFDYHVSFESKNINVSIVKKEIKSVSMFALGFISLSCWTLLNTGEAMALMLVQMLFVALLLLVNWRFSRPILTWAMLLVPLIIYLYLLDSQLDDLRISLLAILLAIGMLYKTHFPIYSNRIVHLVMASLHLLLGIVVVTAAERAFWHSSVDVVLYSYLLAILLLSLILYRLSQWAPITQLLLLSPIWAISLPFWTISYPIDIEWLERGSLIVGFFALFYLFLRFDLIRVLVSLSKKKSLIDTVIYSNHAIYFWALALCTLGYLYRIFSLTDDELLLILPWLCALFIAVCYLPVCKDKWPLMRYLSFYRQTLVAPMVLVIACFIGYSLPLFDVQIMNVIWLPIFNAIELTSIAAIMLVAIGLKNDNAQIVLNKMFKWRANYKTQQIIWLAFSGVLFTHAALARGVSYYTMADYELYSLWSSALFQAGLAILWSLSATMATAIGSRFNMLILWCSGALVFALTIIKLFVLDLANRDTVVMVVAVIFVGVVMVLVGYFAPMPKKEHSLKHSDIN